MVYAGGHCHAPACLSIELYMNGSGTPELLCRQVGCTHTAEAHGGGTRWMHTVEAHGGGTRWRHTVEAQGGGTWWMHAHDGCTVIGHLHMDGNSP